MLLDRKRQLIAYANEQPIVRSDGDLLASNKSDVFELIFCVF